MCIKSEHDLNWPARDIALEIYRLDTIDIGYYFSKGHLTDGSSMVFG